MQEVSDNHIEILDLCKIKFNAKYCVQKLDKKEKQSYHNAITDIFKEYILAVQGYIRKNANNIFIPNCIQKLLEHYYIGILKEHEFSFYKQIEAKYKEKDLSIVIRATENERIYPMNNRGLKLDDLNKLNKLYVIMDVTNDGYRIMSLVNSLLIKNDLKRIVMLHKSGILKLDKDIIFELFYHSSPHITRYLFENTPNFDASSILLEYLRNIDEIINKSGMGPKGFFSDFDKIPYVLSLMIVHSKNCYEKDDFLIELIGKLENLDIYNIKIPHKRFFPYIRKIIQILQEIYLGRIQKKNNCTIL